MSDFDLTNRYTLGARGHQFTNLRAINLVKLTKYVENDEALNDQQFWEDYDSLYTAKKDDKGNEIISNLNYEIIKLQLI